MGIDSKLSPQHQNSLELILERIEQMQRHPHKLETKAKQCIVTLNDHGFIVDSPSKKSYLVHMVNQLPFCCCEWKQYHQGKACSHEIAVEMWLAQAGGYKSYLVATKEDAKRQHKKHWKFEDGIWFVFRKDNKPNLPKNDMWDEIADFYDISPEQYKCT
jgi:hypothetical protein